MNTQKGKGLTSDLLTLGFPLGLSIITDMRDNKEKKQEKLEKQDGGMLSEKFIIEAGLSVVPIGLLALNELREKKKFENENKQ